MGTLTFNAVCLPSASRAFQWIVLVSLLFTLAGCSSGHYFSDSTESSESTESSQSEEKNCFCEVSVCVNSITTCSTVIRFQLKGSVDDCSCSVDTVDYFNNNKIYPRLKSLLVKDYFRFYKVNLRKDCPFWTDDGRCAMKTCSVSTCKENDVPEGLKGQHKQEAPVFKVSAFHLAAF